MNPQGILFILFFEVNYTIVFGGRSRFSSAAHSFP